MPDPSVEQRLDALYELEMAAAAAARLQASVPGAIVASGAAAV